MAKIRNFTLQFCTPLLSIFILGVLTIKGHAAITREEMRKTVDDLLTRSATGTELVTYLNQDAATALRFSADDKRRTTIIAPELRATKGDIIFKNSQWFGTFPGTAWTLETASESVLTLAPYPLRSNSGTNSGQLEAINATTYMANVMNEWPYMFMRLGMPGCDGEPYRRHYNGWTNYNVELKCFVTVELSEVGDDTATLSAKLQFPNHLAPRKTIITFEKANSSSVRPKMLTTYNYSTNGVMNVKPYVVAEYLEFSKKPETSLLTDDVGIRPGLVRMVDYRSERVILRNMEGASDLKVALGGGFTLTANQLQMVFWVASATLLFGLLGWRVARASRSGANSQH